MRAMMIDPNNALRRRAASSPVPARVVVVRVELPHLLPRAALGGALPTVHLDDRLGQHLLPPRARPVRDDRPQPDDVLAGAVAAVAVLVEQGGALVAEGDAPVQPA